MRGMLLPIGGNLQTVPYNPIIRKIKNIVSSGDLAIISAASAHPISAGRNYSFIFNTFGINTHVIPIKKRDETDSKKYIKYIEEAGGVFFTGGNQMRLTSLVGGSEIHKLILERLNEDENFIIIGTSAGAAAMPETMIAYGEAEDALLKGSVRVSPGLGFISDIVIDTHLISRNRIWRLLQIVAENPGLKGIGLSENTGMMIYGDGTCEVLGEKAVVIVDGSELTYTNIPECEDNEPFTVKNMKVHILIDGNKLNLETLK